MQQAGPPASTRPEIGIQNSSKTNPTWTASDLSNPHQITDKARRVKAMFANIAGAYDLNNRLHSLGRDQAWRKAAVRLAQMQPGERVLDVACGTGDLALAFARDPNGVNRDEQAQGLVLGVDFTYEMLAVAKAKQETEPRVEYLQADGLALPLADESVDGLSIGFGIRNLTDTEAGLAEFHRVLRPGGRLIVLEFSEPTNPLVRWLSRVYTTRIMPITASWIAGDRSGAYRYLPRSVSTYLSREQMLGRIIEAGFRDTWCKPLTFGIAVCYRGRKAG